MKHLKTSLLALTISAAMLGGCATVGPWDSQEVARLAPADAAMVAGDVVEVLVSEYAPGQTTFALSDGKPGSFGMALESKLRETGYAISVGGAEKPLHAKSLAYILDELGQPGTYRVGVRVEPTFRLDRLYQTDSTGRLTPGSGITLRDGSGRAIAYPEPPAETLPPVVIRFPSRPVPFDPEPATLDLDSGWSVQLMAGINRDDLERNQERLQRQGHDAHIVPLGSQGRLQALRLGPFESLAAARPAMRDMRNGRYADAFLVEPKGGAR